MAEPRKAVLITGAAKRVGRVIATRFAEAGYDVAIHCHQSTREAEGLAAELSAKGVQCKVLVADLADRAALKPLVEAAFAAFPHLSVLINNASVFERFSFAETDFEVFDRHVGINFTAPFFLTQQFAKRLAGEGQVVNIIDSNVQRTTPGYFAYLLSKKSLYEFTRMAARELAPAIRVNGVSPGTVLPSPGLTEAMMKEKEQSLPMRQNASVDDVADAVLMVVSNAALTGQVIEVDGGQQLL